MAASKAATSRWKPPACNRTKSWGCGYPAPLFIDEFPRSSSSACSEKHLKLRLRKGNTRIDAIQFNFGTQPGTRTRAAYRLAINEYMGVERHS